MTFENLPNGLQNIIMYNFETFGKFFISFVIIAWSIWYIKTKYKNYETSPFIAVGVFRFFFTVCAFTNIVVAPLMLFWWYPQFDFEILLQMLIIFYTLLLIVVGSLFVLNIIFFTPALLLRTWGVDPNKEQTDGVIRKLKDLGLFLRKPKAFRKDWKPKWLKL